MKSSKVKNGQIGDGPSSGNFTSVLLNGHETFDDLPRRGLSKEMCAVLKHAHCAGVRSPNTSQSDVGCTRWAIFTGTR